MSSPRGLATSGAPGVRRSPGHSAALDLLAQGWAAHVAPSSTRTVVARRLTSVLRMLAVVLRAEPFSAAAARDLGTDLLATGLCADLADPAACGDALAASLALLRTDETAGALGVPGGGRRLSAALDELAAGFAAAMAVGARSWAKASGVGRLVVFDPRRDAGEAARYALISGIPGGIANGEFRLVYQPLVTLPEGRVRGAEALVRWQHPQEGLIGPARFIEQAEQSGAIVALGGWVLRTACEQAAAWWRELGADAPFVSVNVSPVQLEEPSWVDEVIDALRATGLPPRQLQLEITEQAVLGDGTAVTEGLAALRVAGVRLALDDFGTGYSSLAWLRRLPVHALKIDGSFVDGLRHAEVDTVDAAIVGAMVGMAHALGIEVTAEWVETGVQADRLSALACDLGQGRWFGDAGPGEWVPDLVRRTMGTDPLAQ